jgi:hypothetical protein
VGFLLNHLVSNNGFWQQEEQNGWLHQAHRRV